jgi:UDP-glucosyltransferase BX8/BX9
LDCIKTFKKINQDLDLVAALSLYISWTNIEEYRSRQIMSSNLRSGMSRQILLFPFPYQGHINPMLELASVLHTRGFSITIFHTQFNSIDSTKHPLYDFISIVEGISADQFDPDDILAQIIALNDSCEEPFRDSLRKLLENKGAACLIADIHWYKMHAVAKQLGVASLVLRTGNAASMRWFSSFPVLLEKGYYPLQG